MATNSLTQTYRLPSTRRVAVRPPRARHFSALPQGPKMYQLQPGYRQSEFALPPPAGFISPTTSASEWYVYLALAKVLKFPKNPRQGPYIGWPGLWAYQVDSEGGRAFAGGQVVDYVVYAPPTGEDMLAIRLDTDRYHIFTDSAKQATDKILINRQAKYGRVSRIYEVDFINDKTGEAVCLLVKQAVNGGQTGYPTAGSFTGRLRSNGS